jgi:MFS family permease
VETFQQLVLARAIMGVSEAFYIPAALALVTEFHLGRTRSRAVGLHQMGIYAGIILGGFSGYVADSPDLGWRWAFSLCGWVGMLYALPLFWFLQNPKPLLGANTNDQSAGFGQVENGLISPLAAARELLTNGNFLLLVLYFTLPDARYLERAIWTGPG